MSALTNWLNSARKNSATLGFRNAIRKPSRTALPPAPASGSGAGRAAARQLPSASHNKNNEPASRMAISSCGKPRSTTASPATVATAYTPMPAAWASPAPTPARAEPRSVWRVTTARLAPGVMAPSAHTPINSSQSFTASMGILVASGSDDAFYMR